MPSGQSITIVIPGTRGGNITHLRIIDRGGSPLTITSHASVLSAVNACASRAASGIKITPAVFTVHSGQTVDTTVVIPSGTPTGDYAAIYYAHAVTGKGNVHVAGSVGAQLHWHGVTGTTACAQPKALPQVPQSGIPLAWVIVPALIVVALFIAWGAILRHRHKTGAI